MVSFPQVSQLEPCAHVSPRPYAPHAPPIVDPLGLRKAITDPHILAHVTLEWPDDRHPKLNIYIADPT